MNYVWMVLIGFVVGLLARAIVPGRQNLGFIRTTLLGIAGSMAAGLGGQAIGWYGPGERAGFIASVLGATVILAIVTSLTRSRAR